MGPFPGGRIFERSADGVEHDWGEVVAWESPVRLRCLWHLFFDRSEATNLEHLTSHVVSLATGAE